MDVSWSAFMLLAIKKEDFYRRLNFFVNKKNLQNLNLPLNIQQLTNNLFPKIAKCIRGTDAYFYDCRQRLMALNDSLGPPLFFLTLNLKYIPQFFSLINSHFKVDPINYLDIDQDEIITLINKYPAFLSIVYKDIVLSLKKNLIGNCEFFSPYTISEVYAKVEFQRSGFPHVHFLLWSNNSPDLSSLRRI